MQQPKVSVLIACYNAERWLDETLASVLAQTWPHLEVIVVNDGSRDGSRQRLAAYEARGVRVIEQDNAGQGAALNRALAEASGDYIQFLDADDLLAPDKIARQLERLRTAPGAVAIAAWARFTNDPAEARFQPAATWRDLAPADWLVAGG